MTKYLKFMVSRVWGWPERILGWSILAFTIITQDWWMTLACLSFWLLCKSGAYLEREFDIPLSDRGSTRRFGTCPTCGQEVGTNGKEVSE